MAESVAYTKGGDRAGQYREITPQIESLVAGEPDLTANLANIAAVLREVFDFFWIGFYLARGDDLVLGPFQGPVACTRIKPGKGVCGHAFETRETVIVPDVGKFEGHIACNSGARSEIVVPIKNDSGNVVGVLDVDSHKLNDFSDADAEGLGQIARLVGSMI